MSTIVDLAPAGRYGRPAASASPHDEPVPPKRHVPTPPTREPEKAANPNPAHFTPDAVETWRRSQEEAARRQPGMLRENIIGVDANGRTPHGALPWYWRPAPIGENGRLVMEARQDTPVHVPNAVYADSDEGRHLVRGISEAAAERIALADALTHIPVESSGLTPRQLKRQKHARRKRA